MPTDQEGTSRNGAGAGTSPRAAGPPLFEFRDVTVVRGGRTVLERVSLRLDEGEHLAILGPNGAGKSTLIRAILREFYPVRREGTVFSCRGREVWDVFDLRSAIGVVSNDLQQAYDPGATGREVVLSGFFSSIGLFNHRVTPAMLDRAESVGRFLGIGHLLDRPIGSLSSGEARRCLVGRALVHDPAALLLDEPTNSLDLSAQHTLRRTLRRVARAGTAVIVVTHQLHDIIPECGRVVLMKEGRIVADGPTPEVLTDDRIGALFGVPVRLVRENGWYYATGY
ncbi:MAG TPA: ATP-binding cassette domain-containing protein [Methanoregulaceae archaeon]|nr:ATP-binding cassette domain-containing protein [Methanoregulaceae archaeon]HQJ87640.1 ATP-binding cassette domain-containing protein [Methanoregulaceae archaeon]